MKQTERFLRPLIALTLLLCAALAAPPLRAEDDRRLVVHVEKQPRSSGVITFRFTPTGGETEEVVVEIAKKQKTKAVAQSIMGALANVVDPDEYKVKMKDERKINVEGRHGNTFELVLAEMTVDGLSVFVRKP